MKFLMFTKGFMVIGLIGLSLLLCCPIVPDPRTAHRPVPQTLKVTPANLITQEVNVLDNLLSGEVINCSVIASMAKDDNPWVKIEKEEVESINIIESNAQLS